MKLKAMDNCWKSVKENATQMKNIARSCCRSVTPHVGRQEKEDVKLTVAVLTEQIKLTCLLKAR